MKKSLTIILLVMVCSLIVWAKPGYPAADPNSDLETLIRGLEKSIAEQERMIISLRARYARIISQKKLLSDWIEQEKLKLEQKQAACAQPKIQKIPESTKPLPEKKKDLAGIDRELQMSLALEKKKRAREGRDINYLSVLIKKQKELCAAIIRLEADIAAEEKILKKLKASRGSPVNS